MTFHGSEYITIKEAAGLLTKRPTTIYEYIRSGKLYAVKGVPGNSNAWKIKFDDFIEFKNRYCRKTDWNSQMLSYPFICTILRVSRIAPRIFGHPEIRDRFYLTLSVENFNQFIRDHLRGGEISDLELDAIRNPLNDDYSFLTVNEVFEQYHICEPEILEMVEHYDLRILYDPGCICILRHDLDEANTRFHKTPQCDIGKWMTIGSFASMLHLTEHDAFIYARSEGIEAIERDKRGTEFYRNRIEIWLRNHCSRPIKRGEIRRNMLSSGDYDLIDLSNASKMLRVWPEKIHVLTTMGIFGKFPLRLFTFNIFTREDPDRTVHEYIMRSDIEDFMSSKLYLTWRGLLSNNPKVFHKYELYSPTELKATWGYKINFDDEYEMKYCHPDDEFDYPRHVSKKSIYRYIRDNVTIPISQFDLMHQVNTQELIHIIPISEVANLLGIKKEELLRSIWDRRLRALKINNEMYILPIDMPKLPSKEDS